jgi:hypothetical protein
MKPTLGKPILLLLLLPFLFFSCTKKEIEEIVVKVAPDYSWKASSNFLYKNKIQMNSYAGESDFYLLGFEALSKIHFVGDIEHATSFVHFIKSPLEYKFPVTATLFASATHNTISFTSTKNPASGGSVITLNMADIDPAFAKFDFVTYETGECMALTKNNVALIPYLIYDKESYATPVVSGSKLLLVKLEATGSTNEIFTVSETRIIDNLRNDQVKYIQAFDNYYYISFRGGRFIRISEDGMVEELLAKQMFPVFKHAGILYGFSYDDLYKSATGKNWDLVSGITANSTLTNLQMLRYHALSNDLLIATYNSQIFKVELSQKELRLVELDNSGLDGNKITSIARYKNMIYLTTLSGVFHRKESEFLTKKVE